MLRNISTLLIFFKNVDSDSDSTLLIFSDWCLDSIKKEMLTTWPLLRMGDYNIQIGIQNILIRVLMLYFGLTNFETFRFLNCVSYIDPFGLDH